MLGKNGSVNGGGAEDPRKRWGHGLGGRMSGCFGELEPRCTSSLGEDLGTCVGTVALAVVLFLVVHRGSIGVTKNAAPVADAVFAHVDRGTKCSPHRVGPWGIPIAIALGLHEAVLVIEVGLVRSHFFHLEQSHS